MMGYRKLVGFFVAVLCLPATLTAQVAELSTDAPGQQVEEIVTIEFYEGATVTSMRLENGDFLAVLSREGGGDGGKVEARYRLMTRKQKGLFQVPGEGVERLYDYRGFHPPDGGDLAAFLEGHTVRSVALAALLLWEERNAALPGVDRAMQDLLVFRQDEGSCPGCTPRPNGCSPSWIMPNTCAGSSILEPCEDHDRCYQCGAVCFGTTRAECDARFRQDVYAATGSTWCADVYYRGVRGLGWFFYQDPGERQYFAPDVYYLGIEMTACEGEYSHLCTRYVM